MAKRETFQKAYELSLIKAVQKHPEEYAYDLSEVPDVAAKMTKALAENNASLGPAAKAAARSIGIKPTLKAIRTYLNEGSA